MNKDCLGCHRQAFSKKDSLGFRFAEYIFDNSKANYRIGSEVKTLAALVEGLASVGTCRLDTHRHFSELKVRDLIQSLGFSVCGLFYPGIKLQKEAKIVAISSGNLAFIFIKTKCFGYVFIKTNQWQQTLDLINNLVPKIYIK